jgi:hypothetical protein
MPLSSIGALKTVAGRNPVGVGVAAAGGRSPTRTRQLAAVQVVYASSDWWAPA